MPHPIPNDPITLEAVLDKCKSDPEFVVRLIELAFADQVLRPRIQAALKKYMARLFTH